MQRKMIPLIVLCLTAILLLAACQPGGAQQQPTDTAVEPTTAATATSAATATTEATATTAATATAAATDTQPAATATTSTGGATGGAGGENTLTAVRASAAPKLDGAADDAAWADAQETVITTSGGGNKSDTQVSVKAVYDDANVYFLLTWADPTQSFIREPWELQQDGTWKVLESPDNKGGDETQYYEDKIALIWSIDNSIKGFETAGCFTACHAGENPDKKPFGNKYTNTPEERGDIWHWKSVRNVGQVDDQYLDNTRYSADTPEAGRKSDPKDAGGYVTNQTEDKKLPAFMQPNGGDKTGAPGYITDAEKVPFDASIFKAGDRVPGVVVAPFTGDRGDLTAGWKYADGAWTLEVSRKLTTGSEFDVQFDDLSQTYYFGLATFDNVQVRHAFETGATAFKFQP